MTQTAFEVRPGRREDVQAVDSLLARSYPQLLKKDYPPSVLVTAIPLIARAQPALVACGTYYVAVTAEGRVVGAGGWTRRDPASGREDGATGNIRHFATDPAFTRRGVARALMARCLRDARGAGVTRLRCYATRTALPFYAAEGFAPLADVEIELRAGIRFPAILMERRLD